MHLKENCHGQHRLVSLTKLTRQVKDDLLRQRQPHSSRVLAFPPTQCLFRIRQEEGFWSITVKKLHPVDEVSRLMNLSLLCLLKVSDVARRQGIESL